MVIPALLTDKKNELKEMINICIEFTDYVQIDIMDGEFVPSRSIVIKDLEGLICPIRSEAHLMVKEPSLWFEPFKKFGAERVIYHFEIEEDHLVLISKAREMGLSVGIAVNPATELKEFEFLVDKVDTVLFMSVNPGFYGARFIPEVLGKIKKFKSKYPSKNVGIDGGIKLSNCFEAKASGVDYLCIGSAILESNNPGKAYGEFIKLFHA
jgi:ribulose-phosphate 3-epimerase